MDRESGPQREHPSWRMVCEADAGIAEVPIYDPDWGGLFWISLFEPALKFTSLTGGEDRTWALPSIGGSYALVDDGKSAIVAVEDGIYHLNLSDGSTDILLSPPYEMDKYKFNDGRCDPAGRFWVGTMPQPGAEVEQGSGFFYCVSNGEIIDRIPGVTVANGIAFSPSGDRMYLADRINDRILGYRYDPASGKATDEYVFTTVEHGMIPDGAAVDDRGGYWIAMFRSGEVRRYDADGRWDRTLEMPFRQPTMCSFGGADRATLFVASGTAFMSPEDLAEDPHAGSIISLDVGERGLPEPKYRL